MSLFDGDGSRRRADGPDTRYRMGLTIRRSALQSPRRCGPASATSFRKPPLFAVGAHFSASSASVATDGSLDGKKLLNEYLHSLHPGQSVGPQGFRFRSGCFGNGPSHTSIVFVGPFGFFGPFAASGVVTPPNKR